MSCDHLFCWYPRCIEDNDKCPRLGEFPTQVIRFRPYQPRRELAEVEIPPRFLPPAGKMS